MANMDNHALSSDDLAQIKVEINRDDVGENNCGKEELHFNSQRRLDCMKADIHSKGTVLSTAWNDLYNLLSEYQAELFTTEGELLCGKNLPEGDTSLRRNLVEKESLVKQLQARLTVVESEVETVRLDLSVKNSLLKKYQDDLLEKEAALMSSRSQIRKLENKYRLLEGRVEGRPTDQTPVRGPRSSLINAKISSISQKRKAATLTPTSTPKKSSPAVSTPNSAPAPVVCLDDEVEDVKDLITSEQNDSYWGQNSQTEATSLQSLPGASEGPVFPGQEGPVFPGQSDGPVFPPMDPLQQLTGQTAAYSLSLVSEGGEGALIDQAHTWDQPHPPDAMFQVGGEVLTPKKSPKGHQDSPKRYACPQCPTTFTRMRHVSRHVATVHMRVNTFQCPVCSKEFNRKDYAQLHIAKCMLKPPSSERTGANT